MFVIFVPASGTHGSPQSWRLWLPTLGQKPLYGPCTYRSYVIVQLRQAIARDSCSHLHHCSVGSPAFMRVRAYSCCWLCQQRKGQLTILWDSSSSLRKQNQHRLLTWSTMKYRFKYSCPQFRAVRYQPYHMAHMHTHCAIPLQRKSEPTATIANSSSTTSLQTQHTQHSLKLHLTSQKTAH